MPLGEYFEVVVNIGNEFGLYRRDYLKAGERIFLQCSLRNNADAAFKLVFHSTSDMSVNAGSEYSVREDGRLMLNDRGKVVFRVAIDTASSSQSAAEATREHMSLMVTVHSDSKAAWTLFPVVSLPFDVVDASQSLVEGNIGDLGAHCCRPVEMDGIDREILLAESPGNLGAYKTVHMWGSAVMMLWTPRTLTRIICILSHCTGIGGKLWDSCLVMTRYLALNRELIEKKSVVELGSGLGLVGIFCAMLGANVTLTDIDEVVPLLQYNIALNFPLSTSSSSTDKSVVPSAATHFWGTSTANLPVPHPDVLVLSDVVYDPEGYVPLVTSLDALATERTEILMAHRSRNPMEHQFFDLLGEKFTYELIDWASCFAAHDKIGEDDDVKRRASSSSSDQQPENSQRVLQDVKIFRMRRL